LGKFALLTGFVSMRIVWNTIHTSILEGLIDQRFPEIEHITDTFDVDPLETWWGGIATGGRDPQIYFFSTGVAAKQ
jgi:hypothetical protein